jgi:hypothetical protein
MHKSATKCNETVGKWCKNKHGASKIIDTLETYQEPPSVIRYLGTPNLGKITSLSIFNEVSPSALFIGIASTQLVT